MANPPITIGNITTVPAPGSPIKSDWAQTITNRVVFSYASSAALATFAAPNGTLAITTDLNMLHQRIGSTWVAMGPRSKVEAQLGATLTGAFNTETQVGTVTVPTWPVARTAFVTCAAISNSGAIGTASVWELRVKAAGLNIARAQNLLGLTIVCPSVYYTVPANTAVTFTAHALMTQGTGPWTVTNDPSVSRLDVLAWP